MLQELPKKDYPQLFDYLTELLTHVKISHNLNKFWNGVRPVLLNNMIQNGCTPNFQKELEDQFKKLEYAASKEEEGPFCSKTIQKYFTCNDCTVKTKDTCSCYCKQCFQLDRHVGHNFRLMESKLAVCDCGDPNSMDENSFCSMHKVKVRELTLDQSVCSQFIDEMLFVMMIIIGLHRIKADFTDDARKKELFGMAFLKRLSAFIDKSYSNKIMTARFFAHKMESKKCPSMTVLRFMFDIAMSANGFLEKLNELVLPLYTVRQMRELVINQYFQLLVSKFNFITEKSPLSKVMFQYLGAEHEVEQAIKRIGPLVINYTFHLAIPKWQAYFQLFTLYISLMNRRNPAQMVVILMEKLDISQLAGYYSPKLQKTNKNEFYSLEVYCFEVTAKIIKNIIKAGRRDLLKQIMRDCIHHIKQKQSSPSMSVERTFALAFFAYSNYNLEEVFDMDEDELLDIFEEEDEELLGSMLEKLVMKALMPLKMDNITDLKRNIYSRSNSSLSTLILSADHIYLKSLLHILIRLHQPSPDSLVQPLINYVQSRQRALSVLLELFLQEEIGKVQETIEMFFYELSLMMSHLVFLAETSLYELIATSFLDSTLINKPAVFEFFEFLIYIYEPPSIKEFREKAAKYINSDKLIEQFVRTAYSRYKGVMGQAVVPGNHFNLSYASSYIQYKSFKESAAIYELKLRNYRRSELSRYIFSTEMLEHLSYLFDGMFSTFLKHFRNNETPNARVIMTNALESVILLALETKDTRFDTLAARFISTGFFTSIVVNISQEDYARNLIQMYQRSQKQLAEDKKKSSLQPNITNEDIDKKIKEKAAIRMKRMNELKEKQRLVLANADVQPEQIDKQQQVCCTICKSLEKPDGLYYLCHMRFSNFIKMTKQKAKKEQKELAQPFFIISTCGHVVHMACLKRSIEITDQVSQGFDFNCFLCKSYSNSLFPIICKKEAKKQANIFLPKLASFVICLMEDIPYLAKQINYGTFNIQSLLLSSMAECIYYYCWQFPKYFMIKLLPAIKVQLLMLQGEVEKIRSYKSQLLDELQKLENTHKLWTVWVKIGLIYAILEENPLQFQQVGKKLQQKFSLERDLFERIALILKQMGSSEPIDSYDLVTKYQFKDNYERFLQLPNDLLQLNSEVGKCPTCKRPTSKIMLCFLCGFKTCQGCESSVAKHVELHLGGCIFIRVEMGDCLYYYETDRLNSKSLYIDYAGEQIENSTIFPAKDTFLLSPERRNVLCQNAIDDMISMEVIMKGHRSSRCNVQ